MKLHLLRIALILTLFTGCSPFRINYERERYIASVTTNGSCSTDFISLLKEKDRLASSVGFEFEGAFPDHLSFYDLALLVKKNLKQQFPSGKVSIQEVDHKYGPSEYKVILMQKEGETLYPKVFTIKDDASLEFKDPLIKGVEITSPVMRTNQDYDSFLQVLKEVQRGGVIARQDVGGVHIHYGLPLEKGYADLMSLYELFVKAQDSLMAFFKVHPGRGYQNVIQTKKAYEAIKKIAKKNPHQKLDSLTVPELNQRSILRIVPSLGTWEVRFFNSTLDPEINQFYQSFVNKIFSLWQSGDADFLQFIAERETISAYELLQFLGLNLQKSEVLMERLIKENGLIEQGQSITKELKRFWTLESPERPKMLEEAPELLSTLIARDFRFQKLEGELQEQVLQYCDQETSLLHKKWRRPSLQELNRYTTPTDPDSYFAIFHQYFNKNPQELEGVLMEMNPAKLEAFIGDLLKDFTKNTHTYGAHNARSIGPEFLKLLIKVNDKIPAELFYGRFFPLFNRMRLLTHLPQNELTELVEKVIEGLIKREEAPHSGVVELLAFINKRALPLETPQDLALYLRDDLYQKFNFNTFYQYVSFIKTYPQTAQTAEHLDLIINTLDKYAPRLSRNERVNLILLFKEFEDPRFKTLSDTLRALN